MMSISEHNPLPGDQSSIKAEDRPRLFIVGMAADIVRQRVDEPIEHARGNADRHVASEQVGEDSAAKDDLARRNELQRKIAQEYFAKRRALRPKSNPYPILPDED